MITKKKEFRTVSEATIKTTPYRWLILALFGSMNFCSSWIWVSLSSIEDDFKQFYNASNSQANFLPMMYYIIYFPAAPLSFWMITKHGLRRSVLFAALGTSAGAVVRLGGMSSGGYIWLVIGNGLGGFGLPFLLSSITMVAANWFPDKEKTLATSVVIVANQFGSSFGYIVAFAIDSDKQIPTYNAVIAAFTCSVGVAIYFLFHDRPEYPPSCAAAHFYLVHHAYDNEGNDKTITPATNEGEKSLIFQLSSLFRNRDFMAICFMMALTQGVLWTVTTLFDEILHNAQGLNYTSDDANICALLALLFGLVGMLSVGTIVDHTKAFKLVMIGCVYAATVALFWFTVALGPNNLGQLAFVSLLFGTFMSGIGPVALEAAVEVTYPISEGLSSGVVMCLAQGFAIGFTYIADGLQNPKTQSEQATLWFYVGTYAVASLLVSMLFQPPLWKPGTYKRLEEERAVSKDAHDVTRQGDELEAIAEPHTLHKPLL